MSNKPIALDAAGNMIEMLPHLEVLGSIELGSAAVTTGPITIPARKRLVLLVTVAGYSAVDIASLRFNGDTAANYWSRYISSVAGGAVLVNNQNVSQTLARLFALTGTARQSAIVHLSNLANVTKVGKVEGQTGTGATATAGGLEFGGFEWINTSAQITSVEMRTAGGTATLSAGSGFVVLGRDL